MSQTVKGVIHTASHSPGGCCFHVVGAHADGGDAIFSGDTLFYRGPEVTGRSVSDYDTIVTSICRKLFGLPAETIVHTGHGDRTTINAELAALGLA